MLLGASTALVLLAAGTYVQPEDGSVDAFGVVPPIPPRPRAPCNPCTAAFVAGGGCALLAANRTAHAHHIVTTSCRHCTDKAMASCVRRHAHTPVHVRPPTVNAQSPPARTSCDLFVATDGSDANKGTSAAAPFKTLQHAIWWGTDATQGARTICLRAGVHRLNATVSISGKFAHANRGLDIRTYAPDLAAGLGRAVLSGGVVVGPFTRRRAADNWLTAARPAHVDHRPSLMFMRKPSPQQGMDKAAEDEDTDTDADTPAGWLQRARLPKPSPDDAATRHSGDASTFRYVGPLQQPNASKIWPDVDKTGFLYNSTDSFARQLPLHRQDEVQVLHFHAWTAFWSDVKTIADGTLQFATPSKTVVGQWAKQGGQRYLLENVKEGLDDGTPGDWYWDDGSAEVLLIPPAAGPHPTQPVYAVAAQLPTLLRIQGASHVSLRDLVFEHADDGGRVDQYYPAAAALLVGSSHGPNTTDVRLERVAVQNCGAVGISMQGNVQRLSILDCAVRAVGASGIEFTTGAGCSDVLINNTLVNDTARVFLGQPGGIRVKGQRNMSITHNTVGFSPYAGIMVGWQQITARTQKHTIFDIGHNHVHDYGMGILSDFGGIYISSADNTCFQKEPPLCHLPTHVHHNHIHDGRRYNYGCEGIYMDEQVSGVVMESNLVHDTADEGFYFHCGSDNVASNNIVAFTGRSGKAVPDVSPGLLPGMCNGGGNPTWPAMGSAVGFNFSTNIVLLGDGAAKVPRNIAYAFKDTRNTHWASNTYYSLNASVLGMIKYGNVWPNGTTLAEWSASAHAGRGKAASRVADPMFVDARGRNFALRLDSPARQHGFRPFGTSTGCHNNPFLPVQVPVGSSH